MCPTTHGRERCRNLSQREDSLVSGSEPAEQRIRDLPTPPGPRLVNDLGDSRRAGTDPGRQAVRGPAAPIRRSGAAPTAP